MKVKLAAITLLSIGMLLMACDEDTAPAGTDKGTTTDDGGADDKGTTGDGTGSAREFVIKSFVVPTTQAKAKDNAYDIDGDGKVDNAFGAVLAAIHDLAKGVDMEQVINQNILNGNDVGLIQITAADFSNDANASFQGWTGDRETCCPNKPCKEADVAKTCFSGTHEFKVDAKSPKDAKLSGAITSGTFEFKGSFEIELPIGGARARVTLLAAKVTGKVDASGISEGKIMGAVSQADVAGSVIPAVAKTLDWEMNDPTTSQATKDAIKKVFDTDNDGKISEKELSDNAAVKAVLAGDVDADKDGKKEELSIGIGFRASGCKIKMN